VLADPARTGEPARDRLRLAGYLVLAAPLRMAILAVLAVALWVVSTIAFAAVVTITVSFVACLSSRVVLPDADRLAERLAARGRT
jgi:Na+-transporting NADH:ubiquinone oxidoreductase subunit NqrD